MMLFRKTLLLFIQILLIVHFATCYQTANSATTSKSLVVPSSSNPQDRPRTNEAPTLQFFLKFIYPSDAEKECRFHYPDCAQNCYDVYLKFLRFRVVDGFYADRHLHRQFLAVSSGGDNNKIYEIYLDCKDKRHL